MARHAPTWANVGAGKDRSNQAAVGALNRFNTAESGESDTRLPSTWTIGQTAGMRLTDFWERMDAVFGPEYARSWAHDHVMSALGQRSVYQAIDAGIDTKEIWRAVCGVADVPSLLR